MMIGRISLEIEDDIVTLELATIWTTVIKSSGNTLHQPLTFNLQLAVANIIRLQKLHYIAIGQNIAITSGLLCVGRPVT